MEGSVCTSLLCNTDFPIRNTNVCKNEMKRNKETMLFLMNGNLLTQELRAKEFQIVRLALTEGLIAAW